MLITCRQTLFSPVMIFNNILRGRNIIFIMLLQVLSGSMCLAQMGLEEMGQKESITMKISLDKTNYFLGEEILVNIDYQNQTSIAITIPDPQNSFDAEVHLLDVINQEDLSYSMGVSETTIMGNEQWALSVPVPDNINIAPNAIYHFLTDVNERLYLRPGKFSIFVTDVDSKSEPIEISITLNKTALSHLSFIAVSTDQNYSRREWAMTNVQEIYPRFILKLPDESDSTRTITENEKYNQLQYQTFMTWLSTTTEDITKPQ